MKLMALVLALGLVGCASQSVPVKPKFPSPPQVQSCPELKQLPKDAVLSQIAETIDYNYTQYYLCSLGVDTWQQWYTTQKKLYEAKKP